MAAYPTVLQTDFAQVLFFPGFLSDSRSYMQALSSSLPRLVVACADTHAFLPLHKVQATRQLEQQAAQALPPHTLMQRAGLAVARVALAVAPHARTIWIACGYGNNGGDGLQAAACLQRWGKQVKVSTLAPQQAMPVDAQAAWQEAVAAGVCFVDKPPALHADDLCIDALLGIGAHRAPDAAMQACLAAMRHSPAPVLAVDIPSGLLADTGTWADDTPSVCTDHTVTLLTLKPGLFTAHGRDAAGQIWWHDLDVPTTAHTADARLQGASLHALGPTRAQQDVPVSPSSQLPQLPYASHKGRFGDVCVIGGDTGMQGAAILAGEAALHSGAGRVYVGLLHAPAPVVHDAGLMLRHVTDQQALAALPCHQAVTVCGCGCGSAIAQWLPDVLQQAPYLVLDADALNAIAASEPLQALLRQRAARKALTVLTPHPLEAARLLRRTAAAVQRDRLDAAHALAEAFQCIVVLKGSGSVCVMPAAYAGQTGTTATINYSGNARLATAGTGDVLAGCIGAYWAQARPFAQTALPDAAWHTAWRACYAAVHAHGHAADQWNACTMHGALSAQRLARSLQRPDSDI